MPSKLVVGSTCSDRAYPGRTPELAYRLLGRTGDRIWLRLGIWIDADAHVEDAADLIWPSADRFGSGVDPAPHGGNLSGGHVAQRGEPAVGEPAGDSERGRPEDPAIPGSGGWLGFYAEVADAVVAPVVGVSRGWE